MNAKSVVVLGLLSGVLVGTVAGLVFAPRPGKETRQAVRERAEQLRQRIKGNEDEMEDPADYYAKLLG